MRVGLVVFVECSPSMSSFALRPTLFAVEDREDNWSFSDVSSDGLCVEVVPVESYLSSHTQAQAAPASIHTNTSPILDTRMGHRRKQV